MQTLIVADTDVPVLLPMAECIETMAGALAALSRGDAMLPLRQVLKLPGTPNLFAVMPGQLGPVDGRPSALGAKIITVFPGNDRRGLDSHLGVVLLFDDADGRLLAIIDASSVTAIRTAAVSGLATRLLARHDAGDLAILGSGVQAMTHLEAMRCVRTVRRVRVWSRSQERCLGFASAARQRWGVAVDVAPTAEACVRDADLVCTVTASHQPVLRGIWLAEGAHVNAVGAALPTARELDMAAVVRARVFVDRRESAMAEAGDLLIPMTEGAIDGTHIRGELGELLLGDVPGREDPAEVTLFKSLGLAIEDLAAARRIYEKAAGLGTGVWVSFGGLRNQD